MFNGTKVLADVRTPFTPRTGRCGFAAGGTADVGGLKLPRVAQWIDDVSILINRDISDLSRPAFAGSVATNLSWFAEYSGFSVRTIRGSFSVCSLAAAEEVLANPVLQ